MLLFHPTTLAFLCSTKKCFRTLFSALLFLGFVASAYAQSFLIEGAHGSGDRIHSIDIPQNVALEGFRFGFRNGGHKIKKIGVLRQDRHVVVNFSDNDGNDPITYLFRYREIENSLSQRQTLTGGASGQTTVELDPPGAGFIPVLQGFALTFEDGEDHEISEVGVSLRTPPQHLQNEAVITFRDHEDEDASFSFVVQVLWVAGGAVQDESVGLLGSGRPDNRLGPAAIRSFNYRYVKGDGNEDDSHYIAEMWGDLGEGGAGLVNSAVRFHDGDRDDRTRRNITFVTLNP